MFHINVPLHMPRLAPHAVQGELKPLANVRNIIAVGSGKGGVGKSTTAVNLALALAGEGHAVGVLDADVYGPSVPMMLGLSGRPDSPDGKTIEPMRAHGIEAMSIGLLVDQDTPMIWRGPMATSALTQLLTETRWGDLDILIVDLPPGTGDIQMGLARMLPRSEVIIVTTPALAAQTVAGRAADMARKGHLRVAGVIENMSAFVCEHGTSYPLFGTGGGARLAAQVGVPLLGQVPMEPSVAAGGDVGRPVALGDGPAAEAFRELARVVAEEAVPVVEVSGCSAASILASF